MAKKNLKKQKLIKNPSNSSITTPSKTINKKHNTPKPNIPTRADSDSESESEPIPIKLQKLLEPYTKDQLVTLAVDTALSNPLFYNLIQSTADKDITHRKIFVYGLARDTTRQTLVSVFEEFGEVEECNVVMDHGTGKAKGYAFVVFKTRKSAAKALKEPQKRIGNRMASCKLASLKDGVDCNKSGNELGSRKIYVSNVAKDVNSEELRVFFEKFGEIEAGPMGFDPSTGRSKGYALFVYKMVEGAKRCLEEPDKLFNGRQLHCKKAIEGKSGGGGAASITSEVVQAPPFMTMPYGAVVADQNMAMMNPFYGGVLPYGAYVNPFVGVGGFGQQMGIAGYGGALMDSLGGGGSIIGAYGSGGGGGSSSGGVAPGLLQAYPNKQVGQPSPAKLPGSSGYSSHL